MSKQSDAIRKKYSAMSREELVSLSNRGKRNEVGIYRRIGVGLFIKPLLGSRILPNHITFLRIVLTLLSIGLILLGDYGWKLIGVLLIHFTIVLDKLDGPFARFTGQTTAIGKYLDVIMDHSVSAVMFYALLGVLAFQSTNEYGYLALMIASLVVAHVTTFSRAITLEQDTVLKGKVAGFAFSDNLIFIMQLFSLGIIFRLEALTAITLFVYQVVKLALQWMIIARRSRTHVNKRHLLGGYFTVVIYIAQRVLGWNHQRTATRLKRNFSDLKVYKQVHGHFVHEG
jgi:phosphatidylglycerophosphate synthase